MLHTGSRVQSAIRDRASIPPAGWIAGFSLIPALMIIATAVFRVPELYPPLITLRLQLISGILLICSFAFSITRNNNVYLMPEMKLIFIFLVVTHVSALFAINPGISYLLIYQHDYWKIVLVCIIISYPLSSAKALKWLIYVVVASGLSMSIAAFVNKLLGTQLVESTERVTIGRDIGSILGDPNELALLLLISLGFSLALTVRGRKKLTAAFGIMASAAMIIAIMLTQSRGGLVGLVVLITAFAWRLPKLRTVFITSVILAGIPLFYSLGVGERAFDGTDASAESRITMWTLALEAMFSHPITGVGVGNFEIFSFRYGHWKTVHNTWLLIGAETGIPGLLVFTGALYYAMCSLSRAFSQSRGSAEWELRTAATAALCGFAGVGASSTFLSEAYTWPLYFLLSIAAAAGRYAGSIGSGAPSDRKAAFGAAPSPHRLFASGRRSSPWPTA